MKYSFPLILMICTIAAAQPPAQKAKKLEEEIQRLRAQVQSLQTELARLKTRLGIKASKPKPTDYKDTRAFLSLMPKGMFRGKLDGFTEIHKAQIEQALRKAVGSQLIATGKLNGVRGFPSKAPTRWDVLFFYRNDPLIINGIPVKMSFTCEFDDTQLAQLGKLKSGSPIRVQGKIASAMIRGYPNPTLYIKVTIEDCTLK